MWVSMSVLSWVWLSVMFFLGEGKCMVYNSPFGCFSDGGLHL